MINNYNIVVITLKYNVSIYLYSNIMKNIIS